MWRCPNASCPAKHPPRPGALRLARRDEHRRAGRVARRSARSSRAWCSDFADLYRLEAAQLESLVVTPREPRSERAGRASWARSAATSSPRSSAARRNDLSRLHLRPGHPPRGREGRGDPGAAVSDDGARDGGAGGGAAIGGRVGPVVAASVRAFADEPRNRGPGAPAGAGRRQHGEPGARTAREPGPLAGKIVRADRHAVGDDAAKRRPRRWSGSARGCPGRSARRPATSWSGPTPGASWRRRASWASKRWMRRRFWLL